MALLFLDHSKEASRFSSSSTEEAFVRIAPNNSCKNSVVWGTDGTDIYFGHGTDTDENDVKKEFIIRNGCVGIGNASPAFVLDIPLPKQKDDKLQLPPTRLLNVADIFVIHEDRIEIQKGPVENKVDVYIPTSIYNHVGIGTCASNRHECIIYGNSGSFEIHELFIGTPIGSTKIHSRSVFARDVTFENSIIVSKNVQCKSIQCDGDLNISQCVSVKGSLNVNDIAVRNNINTMSMHISTDIDVVKNATVGGDIMCQGDVSIGTNYIKPGTLLIKRDLQLCRSKMVGIGIEPTCSLDVLGKTCLRGDLFINAPKDSQHQIYGNVSIDGKVHISKELTVDGTVIVQDTLHVGQEYHPVPLIVYGITHLSQNVYIHGSTYFDKGVRVGGTITCASASSEKEPVVIAQKGSIYLENGCLGINVTKVNMTDVFHVHGTSKMDGTLEVTRDATIRGTFKCAQDITTDGNLFIKKEAVVDCNILSKKDIICNETITCKNALIRDGVVGIGTDKPKERLHIIGNSLIDGNVQVNSISTVSGNSLFNNGSVGIKCSNPTETLDVRGTLRIQNKRFGIFEPTQGKRRLLQFVRVPYQNGNTTFYMKLEGIIRTLWSYQTIRIEFSGTSKNPTMRVCNVNSPLCDDQNRDVSHSRHIKFYRDPATRDIIGCIYFHQYPALGFEFNIDISNQTDIYEWKHLDDFNVLKTYEILWSPLDNPIYTVLNDAIYFERRVGIGETSPQFMLDVKKEARFQSQTILQGETYTDNTYTKLQAYELTGKESACDILNRFRVGVTNTDGDTDRYGISYVPSKNIDVKQMLSSSYLKTDELLALLVKAVQELSQNK